MKTIQNVLFVFLLACVFVKAQTSQSRTGILILGASHHPTLSDRVNSGYQLFKALNKVDYIIVSGGCDAHNSGFCEASRMEALLLAKGVSETLIFKEEQSKSTYQNYCYSRRLKNKDGNNIIQQGDTLYVVSNHWHAIPVAARFRRDDKVHAQYYIRGAMTPTDTDKVNYTNIYSDKISDSICN